MVDNKDKRDNEQVFKKTFNQIEGILKRICDKQDNVGFSKLVDLASEKNPYVKKFSRELKSFARLRNALVHSSTEKFMAEPYDETVEEIKKIHLLIMDPPKIRCYFLSDIEIGNESDHILSLLKRMIERNFSQVPVYNRGKFSGLLTTDTIARWLSTNTNGSDLLDGSVGYVLEFTENPLNYHFASQDADVLDVLSVFEGNYSKGSNISAVLVTQKGSEDEPIIGILTAYDIPKMRKIVNEKLT